MVKYKHFKDSEVEGLNEDFCKKLDQAREIANVPFRITSGRRTLLQNEQITGSAKDSAHLEGLAVDLFCDQSQARFKIIDALLSVGFCRIGVYMDGHIHVDLSSSLPQNVFWVKP